MRDIVRDKGLFRKGLIGLAAIISGCTGYKYNTTAGVSSIDNVFTGVANMRVNDSSDEERAEISVLGEQNRAILNAEVKVNGADVDVNTSWTNNGGSQETKILFSVDGKLNGSVIDNGNSLTVGGHYKRFLSEGETGDDNFSVAMSSDDAGLGGHIGYGHKFQNGIPTFSADFTYYDGNIRVDGETRLDGEVVGKDETVIPYNQWSLSCSLNKKDASFFFDVANETGEGIESKVLTALGGSVNFTDSLNLAGILNSVFDTEYNTQDLTLILSHTKANKPLAKIRYLKGQMERVEWYGERDKVLDLVRLLSSPDFESGSYVFLEGLREGGKPRVTLAGKIKHNDVNYLGTVSVKDYRDLNVFAGIGVEW
jgi:uncharacterized glyoxalase superfamily protein PhnB